MDVKKLFGSRVFSERVQKERLSKEIYESLKETRERGSTLQPRVAREVARAMMEWAIEQGATHYAHWFQPMTNITAGKQDAFLEPGEGGGIVNRFSELMLIKGEPDASSFPNGGLRASFEARGYTTWDPTSPAFVKEDVLYIPTAFCSYTGEALDAKTPLLRAMQALSREALELLRTLGDTDTNMVIPTVGVEQEYFLIDREKYERRLDIKICGRTLVGAKPPKGQELDDHYCGRIRLRVAAFMRELDAELWSYGIHSKTRHNEAAPGQHEFACLYNTANIACDHNQLAMELARIVAKKHGLVCLLHEKPFDGVNGSGKHNNFSLATDTGKNLLSPGEDPANNTMFLLLLAAFIRSVDKYADLLYLSTASAGNGRRLGGFEAPPAIISIFLGLPLTEILEQVAAPEGGTNAVPTRLITGVEALPMLQKDDSDRNRTSPFAFTGNKFEFRMVGSSQSVAMPNTVLCTILADSLSVFKNRLSLAEDKALELREIVRDTMRDHGRILYNGNNYSQEWRQEAARRGLRQWQEPGAAFASMTLPKNVALFERFSVFSESECRSRRDIMAENYQKVVSIEVATLLEMVTRELFPASLHSAARAARDALDIERLGVMPGAPRVHAERLSDDVEAINSALEVLRESCKKMPAEQPLAAADYAYGTLIPALDALRAAVDSFESHADRTDYPVPNYVDLLHRV